MLCYLHDQISVSDVDLVTATIHWHLLPDGVVSSGNNSARRSAGGTISGSFAQSTMTGIRNLFGYGLFNCR
jgi:hypothetical protein